MPNPELCLHSAARIYAAESYAKWAEYYVSSEASSRPNSRESYEIFPRYLMLAAVRVAVERLDADHLPALNATRAQLVEAVRHAGSVMTDHVASNAIAKRAMEEERAKMIAFLTGCDDDALARIEPLPYRHVLPEPEGDRRWRILTARWNIGSGHPYWYPLSGEERPDLLAFDSGHFAQHVPLDVLRGAVLGLTGRRIWEFREEGLSAEIDVELLDPVYTGEEGYWSDPACEWIIYASHESSIAVGGPLLAAIRTVWPDWQQFVWKAAY